MTLAAINYGRVLYGLSVPNEAVKEAEEIFKTNPQLVLALMDPLVTEGAKERVIQKVFREVEFPGALRHFLLTALKHNRIMDIEDIFEAYHQYARREQGILLAELHYVTAPSPEQRKQIEEMLCSKYHMKSVDLVMLQDPSLLGGFLIRVGDVEVDMSMKGRLKQLEQILTRR